ncbi:hypothetical protein [Duganella qianjiadongensis]|uniref:Uncharacterized protein n=1 Tax=Duganella qianjiadongensis TaxID=2692176 RepID=A0ABW9VSY8_9BURK|nr:hypothetical protein [Duganella qianjiadongensis]MYM42191.1 hypothetical protein [Duganella qianjiadongensis]
MVAPIFDTHEYIKRLEDAGVDRKQADAHLEAIKAALDPLIAKSMNKLDSTDFENIYLQTRNRSWKWFLGVAGIFGVGTMLGAWQVINISASKGVAAYVKTESFQRDVVNAAISRLDSLDARTAKAEKTIVESEKRAGALGGLPLSVSENGLVLTDRMGRNFHIETGTAHSGEIVLFKSAFKTRPKLLIQAQSQTGSINDDAFSDFQYRRQIQADRVFNRKERLFNPIKDGSSGFSLRTEAIARSYDWVAIGE